MIIVITSSSCCITVHHSQCIGDVLTILTDLGLIDQDEEGNMSLSADGVDHWEHILQEANNGN